MAGRWALVGVDLVVMGHPAASLDSKPTRAASTAPMGHLTAEKCCWRAVVSTNRGSDMVLVWMSVPETVLSRLVDAGTAQPQGNSGLSRRTPRSGGSAQVPGRRPAHERRRRDVAQIKTGHQSLPIL